MQTIKHNLDLHHHNHQHNAQMRFNLYYTDMAKSSNNTLHVKKDIETLAKRLISRNYVSGYIWILAFDSKLGLHVQVIFYLNLEQTHDALIAMAVELYWDDVTNKECKIVELDVEEDVAGHFANQLNCQLFKHNPEQYVGMNSVKRV